MVCNLIEHLALDQSEHDKSLRYGKIYFSLPRANINESGMYICTLPVRQRSVIMTILECKTFFTFLLQRDFSQINGLSVAFKNGFGDLHPCTKNSNDNKNNDDDMMSITMKILLMTIIVSVSIDILHINYT